MGAVEWWSDGEVERWRGGEVERWGDGVMVQREAPVA